MYFSEHNGGGGNDGMATLLHQKSFLQKTLNNGQTTTATSVASTTTTQPQKLLLPHQVNGHAPTTQFQSQFYQHLANSNLLHSGAAADVNGRTTRAAAQASAAAPQPNGGRGAGGVVETVVKQEEEQAKDAAGSEEGATPFGEPVAAVVEAEPEPEIDIVINNVVCSFSVRCHLNLRQIALNGFNVEYRRENGMVTMKLRRPYTTASVWSSGRITCTGATSEEAAKVAARKYARCLQKLGFRVRFHNFRVVNVLGTCSMPWAIKITQFSEKYRNEASYEPELHPGVTYKLKEPKATLKIFSTGSITVTAASVLFVQQAIEHIFPLVYEFRKKRTPEEEKLRQKHLQQYTDDIVEMDQPGEDGSEAEMDVDDGEVPSTSGGLPGGISRRRKGSHGNRQRRPAGKTFCDSAGDIMAVSEEENSDDDL